MKIIKKYIKCIYYPSSNFGLCSFSGCEHAKCEKSLTTSLNISSPDTPNSESFISSFNRANRSL